MKAPSIEPPAASAMQSPTPLPQENIHGHLQRVTWFQRHMAPSERAVEFGCGTGYMITFPMRSAGYDVTGVDLDETSVAYGRELLRGAGIDESALVASEFSELPGEFDVVIASEVLEHLDDDLLTHSLELIRGKLRPGGRLLVTVPNGYGWFELETFVWNSLRLERVTEWVRAHLGAVTRARRRVAGGPTDSFPSTLADSPHVRRFTIRSLRRTLERAGFEVVEERGSVLFAGPFVHLALTGFPRLMRLNQRLGARLTPIASGFYVAARLPK